MSENTALIGMSGGVDSSVAAFLVQQAGYKCIGATMQLWGASGDIRDAQAVAEKLGMPHEVLSFQKEFKEQVIDDFVSAYESGLTPNPCIVCNKTMKFGCMLQKAKALGCHYVVSGHYAQIRRNENTGRLLLYKAVDRAKDQTYFLTCLDQEQLKHILFPLGSLTKAQVREIAQEQGFLNARKRDSQDICFVPDGDYANFLESFTGKVYPQGNYVNSEGKILGPHQGAVRYTIGQRKGLGIALGAPAYVCGKNMADNTVTLGPNEALFSKALRARNWNWYPFPALTEPLAVTAKIRHSQTEVPATVFPEDDGFARVEFENPQRAISPGQAVVLYQEDMVVGGGTITEAI